MTKEDRVVLRNFLSNYSNTRRIKKLKRATNRTKVTKLFYKDQIKILKLKT